MEYSTAAYLCMVSMIFLLIFGVPIAYALGFSTLFFGYLAFGNDCLYKIGWITFQQFYNLSWTPLPLFVLMACVINETKIGEDLFIFAKNWLPRISGSLVSATILGEALMASAVGVSGAAIVAMGKVAEPELKKYGYNRGFAMGGLMCGGVLGPLIPPSTPMIVYGVIANVSIGHLLIAGIIPGIILALMLVIVPIILCWRNPSLGPPVVESVTWGDRIRSIKKVWPIILVMGSIVGSIYFGVATPTEAAGIGSVVIIIMAVAFFGLRIKGLYRAITESAALNAMMLVIILGAAFFSYLLASGNVGEDLGSLVTSLDVSPILIVVAVMVLYLILGCFLDAITIAILTIPIFVPLLVDLGYDPVWFGVLYTVNLEIGLITPPMGLNLYFMRNVFNLTTGEIIRGAIPFLIALFVFLCIIIIFPELSLWLPGMMK